MGMLLEVQIPVEAGNAAVELLPVMTADDVQVGLAQLDG